MQQYYTTYTPSFYTATGSRATSGSFANAGASGEGTTVEYYTYQGNGNFTVSRENTTIYQQLVFPSFYVNENNTYYSAADYLARTTSSTYYAIDSALNTYGSSFSNTTTQRLSTSTYSAPTSTAVTYTESATTAVSTITGLDTTDTFTTTSSYTYEDGTDTLTDTETYTASATTTATFTSSNWTTAAGPTITTSTYTALSTTSTTLTDTSSYSVRTTTSGTITRTAWTVDLQRVFEADSDEVGWSVTATTVTQGVMSNVGATFTLTSATAAVASEVIEFSSLQSLTLTNSVTQSYTFQTTSSTVSLTSSRTTTADHTYVTFSDGLPVTATSSEGLTLLSTTATTYRAYTPVTSTTTFYAFIANVNITTVTNTFLSYTTHTTYTTVTQSAPGATASTTLGETFTTTEYGMRPTYSSQKGPFGAWGLAYSSVGTATDGQTTYSQRDVVTMFTHVAPNSNFQYGDWLQAHCHRTRGWQAPASVGPTEAIYSAVTAGAILYYPFTAVADGKGASVVLLYSHRTTAQTGDSSYSYSYGGGSLSYSVTDSAAATSTSDAITLGGVSAASDYDFKFTKTALFSPQNSYTFGGVEPMSTDRHFVRLIGAAMARTQQDTAGSTVDTVTAFSFASSTHTDRAVAVVNERFPYIRSVGTNHANFSTAAGIITDLRHPNL